MESPAARALLALEILQASPGITADRLAARLGVSERAARRCVGVLRDAGIPIESVRGPYGGYRVGRGLRLPPLTFTAAEALGLVMAVLDGHHDAGDPAGPVGAALGKLVRALPEQVAAQADAVRRAAASAPDRAAARPDPQVTATLVQACSDARRLRMRYRGESGTEWDAEVDPWAVVVRHGRWYVVCWSHRVAARRAYRIDRIRQVEVLDAAFDPPAPFDAVAVLEEHLAVGWEYAVELVIEAPLETLALRVPPTLGRLQAVDGDRCRLVGSTGNPWWYAEQLAALPVPFRVVGGPELRHTVGAVGSRLLAAASAGDAGAPVDDQESRSAGRAAADSVDGNGTRTER
ncbi:helix-turn-helix transcriptional regulator [Dactylosporangium aurantiacum]|uniref:helix-turn-helix transcriptional regulator n=1 Tax=Dactylosporangium aurantiacum TaxID=35754 RepID=UPI0007C42E6B|nr:WYL domain-containing protein [Dactylosporangium aurantiacum]MDG6107940.1 WYL domain-containing protein [Dactylosporangium aurantiacum]